MADTPKPTEWTEKRPRREPRPHVVFSDHMVVFATNGIRDSLTPTHSYLGGFDIPNHHILAAGPLDLKPENQERLKRVLTRKLEEAKAMPFAPNARQHMRDYFCYNVALGVAEEFTIPAIRYFSKTSESMKTRFNTPESLARITRDKAADHFSAYDVLNEIVTAAGGDDQKAYLAVKKMFKENGRQEDFERLERKAAEKSVRSLMHLINPPPENAEEIVQQSVVVRRDESGQRISMRTEPIEKLRRHFLDETYADLDAIINKARERMVERSAAIGAANPFAYTDKEMAELRKIDDIAHRDLPCRPVMLAGYANPNLTIVVERGIDTVRSTSFGSYDLIHMQGISKQNPFDFTMIEELLHQGIDKIYRNNSLPYRNDSDNRKALLERVIASELPDDESRGILGVTSTFSYNVENPVVVHQELPVKLLKRMGDPQWDEILTKGGVLAYPKFREYATEVIIKDAIAHNQKQPLSDIGDDYLRTASHQSHAERADDSKHAL